MSRLFVLLVAFGIGLLSPPNISSQTTGKGLLYRWKFSPEHLKGDLFSAVHGNLKAKLIGKPLFAKQKPCVIKLNPTPATKQYIHITDDPSVAHLPTNTITVEAWVKVERPQEWGGIVGALQDNGSYERGWVLGFRRDRFCFGLASAGKKRLTYLSAKQNFSPGYWYHLVGSYDGKNQMLYVDGRLANRATEQSGRIVYPPTMTFCIAAYRDDNEFFPLNGEVEQVSLWNRCLTAEEIKERFDKTKAHFPSVVTATPKVNGWPTYRRDNFRSGLTDEELPLPLFLQWQFTAPHPPKPAWPLPAKQDFWHNKFNLKARVIFDRAFQVVVAENRLYFGSSADDRVYCMDAKTGKELWTFCTEGPVRLAPTIAGERILFGSDDGHVYCLTAKEGKLIWKTRVAPSPRRIPGNQRMISPWPVRTGILVEGKKAFCCAGIFPEQGVYQFALDVKDGKILAKGKVTISPQGYLQRKGNRLFVATGRNPAGGFIGNLKRRGKVDVNEWGKIPREYPFEFIGTPDLRIGGGDGKVAAFSAKDGEERWRERIKGKAYSLAIADGRLYVSTDQGEIYCFSPKRWRAIEPKKLRVLEGRNQYYAGIAANILNQAKQDKGYALVLGDTTGKLSLELSRYSKMQFIAGVPNAKVAKSVRAFLREHLTHPRVTVHQLSGGRLPYSDYVFNLVVGNDPAYAEKELKRVLRPNSGVLFRQKKQIFRRDRLKGVGEWTHFYADVGNSACSNDQLVSGPFQLQWFGAPGPRKMIDRHHRTVAPLWSEGILFIPGNNHVFAVDGYNGSLLWEAEVPDSRRIATPRDCSYLAAAKDTLYVAAGDKCQSFDTKTGFMHNPLLLPQRKVNKPQQWGYLATVNHLLVGSSTKPGASRRGHSKEAIKGSYYDFRPLVCSETMFAFDRHSKKLLWTYPANQGLILNPTITIGEGKLFFIESTNPKTLRSSNARATPAELLGKGSNLIALDLKTGKELLRRKQDFSAVAHLLYLCYARGKLVAVGTRNSSTNKKQARVLYDIWVFNADKGDKVWSATKQYPAGIGGSHGEQDHHPVIVGDKLYCEPWGFDLHSGKLLSDFGWTARHRRGCGTISASASTFFFRQSNPTLFDLSTNKFAKVTSCTRPGCWINMIPAGGLLLIPEASSGCTCNYSVQTSLAFIPMQRKGD